MNPLGVLAAPLGVLAEEARVLPATGGAQEYLQRFDLDEYYDRIEVGDERRVTEIRERPNRAVFVPTPAVGRREEHRFQTFIDGCARVTFLGTLVAGTSATPVILAQVGAAAIRRASDGSLTVDPTSRAELRLILDASSVTERIFDRVRSAAEERIVRGMPALKVVDAREATPFTDSDAFGTTKEPRSRAAHRANWEMRALEREVLHAVAADPTIDGEIVVDGGLGREFKREHRCIGVVKNFSKEMWFELPDARGGKRSVNLYTLLARLEVAHRTAAFSRPDGRTALWFVRLRGPLELDYPLMGVIKVEIPVSAGEMLSSDEIDRMSACLVAERTVAPHGRDTRWHAHLYPISQAEQAIRTRFVSNAVLRASVKWPRHTQEQR